MDRERLRLLWSAGEVRETEPGAHRQLFCVQVIQTSRIRRCAGQRVSGVE